MALHGPHAGPHQSSTVGVQVAQVSGETSNEVYLQQWMQAMTRRFGALTRSSLDRRQHLRGVVVIVVVFCVCV